MASPSVRAKSLECSVLPRHLSDGRCFSAAGAGDVPAAVVALTGVVRNVNVLQSAEAGVIDGSGLPVSPSVVGTDGGLSITGMQTCSPATPGCHRRNAANESGLGSTDSSEHPLIIGQSGEDHGRLAIESDGSMLWGDGTAAFDTTLRRLISRTIAWDPPKIAAGKSAVLAVAVEGASPGDVATAAHDKLAAALALLGANVVSDGHVQVIHQSSLRA